MATCPDAVLRLIEHFERQADQVRSQDYNEATLRIQFINPLFAELDWDIDNRQGFAPQYAEVVHEDRVKVAGASKAPDYSFRVGGVRKFFLEAPKTLRQHQAGLGAGIPTPLSKRAVLAGEAATEHRHSLYVDEQVEFGRAKLRCPNFRRMLLLCVKGVEFSPKATGEEAG